MIDSNAYDVCLQGHFLVVCSHRCPTWTKLLVLKIMSKSIMVFNEKIVIMLCCPVTLTQLFKNSNSLSQEKPPFRCNNWYKTSSSWSYSFSGWPISKNQGLFNGMSARNQPLVLKKNTAVLKKAYLYLQTKTRQKRHSNSSKPNT